jgi:hypothetical protein
VAGIAILGNVRLVLLPLLVAGFVLLCARRPGILPATAVVVAAAVTVSPWVVRNRSSVGCATLSTDARAFWKANNEATLETLESGKWIDDVPRLRGAPPTPEEAQTIYRETGRVVDVDECAQMRFYRRRALEFMRDDPAEKAELAALAARMLWQPAVTTTEGRSGAGTRLDTAREWVEPAYMVPLYALGVAGLPFLRRRLAALVLLLLAYNTLAAMLFAGQTRYRVAWDFLIAISAAAAALHVATRIRR